MFVFANLKPLELGRVRFRLLGRGLRVNSRVESNLIADDRLKASHRSSVARPMLW